MRSLVAPLMLCLSIPAVASGSSADQTADRVVTRVVVQGPSASGEGHWREPGTHPSLSAWQERRFWRQILEDGPVGGVRWWQGLSPVRALGVGVVAGPELIAEVEREVALELERRNVVAEALTVRVVPRGRKRADLVIEVELTAGPVPADADPLRLSGVERVDELTITGGPAGWKGRADRHPEGGAVSRRLRALAQRAGVETVDVRVLDTEDGQGQRVAVAVQRRPSQTWAPIAELTGPATLWGAAGGLAWQGRGLKGPVSRADFSGALGYVIYQGWQPKIEFQRGNHGPTGHLAGSVDLAPDFSTLRAHGAARGEILARPGYRGLQGWGVLGAAWQPTRETRAVLGVRSSVWTHRAATGQEDNFRDLFEDGPAPVLARGSLVAAHVALDHGPRPRAELKPLTRVQLKADPLGWVLFDDDSVRFHRVWGRVDRFARLWDDRAMGVVSAEAGFLGGPGGANPALSERFHLGSTTLPGRGWRSLPAPGVAFPDADEPRIGGEVMAALRAEIRYDLAHGVHAIGHANIGRVWLPDLKAPALTDLVPAIGTGLGIQTPIGRFDLMGAVWLGAWQGPGPSPPRVGLHMFLVP